MKLIFEIYFIEEFKLIRSIYFLTSFVIFFYLVIRLTLQLLLYNNHGWLLQGNYFCYLIFTECNKVSQE